LIDFCSGCIEEFLRPLADVQGFLPCLWLSGLLILSSFG
jgi:hypothetical protein